jgi:hypothetical protein
MQKNEKTFARGQTADTTLDSAAAHQFGDKFGYSKDVKYKELKPDEQRDVRHHVDQDFVAKKAFSTDYEHTTDTEQKAAVDRSVQELHTNRAAYVNADGEIAGLKVDVVTRNPNYDKTAPSTDPRSNEFITNTKTIKSGLAGEESAALYGQSQAVGEFVNALRKGTYDLRNLTEAKGKSPGFNKFSVGLLAMTAGIMRAGLKKTGVDVGKSQKDFLKDMGEIITKSLSNVKIDVKDVAKAVTDHAGGHGGGGGHH